MRRRIDSGVTSTSSSSLIHSMACSRISSSRTLVSLSFFESFSKRGSAAARPSSTSIISTISGVHSRSSTFQDRSGFPPTGRARWRYRFHGTTRWYRHDYTSEELAVWTKRIQQSEAARVWAYFNNDREGYAIKKRLVKATLAAIDKAIAKIRDDVSVGCSLNMAMNQVGIFPHMVTQMTAIGEEAGALDTMLFKVAEFYEQEVNNAVDALASLLEPFIMVIIGVMVGGMVIAMYLPIFKLAATI